MLATAHLLAVKSTCHEWDLTRVKPVPRGAALTAVAAKLAAVKRVEKCMVNLGQEDRRAGRGEAYRMCVRERRMVSEWIIHLEKDR